MLDRHGGAAAVAEGVRHCDRRRAPSDPGHDAGRADRGDVGPAARPGHPGRVHLHRGERVRRAAVAKFAKIVLAPATDRRVGHQGARVSDAERDRERIDDALHCHGRRRAGGRPVAKLAEVVVSPAPHRAVGEQRAGMEESGGDADGVRNPAHRDRRSRVNDALSADLAEVVLPPTLDGAILEERAAVIGAEAQRGDVAQSDDRMRLHHRGVDRAVADLATNIAPPAFHGPIAHDGAGVIATPGEVGDGSETLNGRRQRNVGRAVAVAELSVLIASPALNRAVGHDGAGEEPAGERLDRVRHPVHELRRHRESAHRAVAELPGVVRPPALHSAVADERAGMLQPGVKGDGVDGAAGERRLEDIGVGPVADLSLAVLAGAANRLIRIQDAGVPGAGGDRGRHDRSTGRELQRLTDEQRWILRCNHDRCTAHDDGEYEGTDNDCNGPQLVVHGNLRGRR